MADITTANGAMDVILQPLSSLLIGVAGVILLVILGWLIGTLFSIVVKKFLEFIKFEAFLESHRVEDALGKVKLSSFLIQFTKYFVLIGVVYITAPLLGVWHLQPILKDMLDFAINFLVASAIFVTAALAGEFVREKIVEIGKDNYLSMAGNGIKIFIVFMGLLTALNTLGIHTTGIESIIVNVVTALAAGIALAFGISFGLAGQDTAKDLIKEAAKHLKR